MNYAEMTRICDSCLIKHNDTLCKERIEQDECELSKCELCRMVNDDVSCKDCKVLGRCILGDEDD